MNLLMGKGLHMQGGVASVIFRTFRTRQGLSSSSTIPICTIHQLHWPRWFTFLPSPNALAAQACYTNSVSLLGAEAHSPGVRCHVCLYSSDTCRTYFCSV